jgi:type II secretory ATPase GspE/PulE/Tfp pilus assembly ATPase PilB-like protein
VEPEDQDIGTLRGIGIEVDMLKDGKFARSAGCDDCFHSGYQGRTAIYELLAMTENMRELVMKEVSAAELKRAAIAGGMKTLRQDGMAKVIDGVTSPEEVMRVTQLDLM